MMTQDYITKKIIPQIKKILKKVHPLKVIIFGSFACGVIHEYSDIDLLVVLNKSGVAKNYSEILRNKINLSKLLREVRRQIPLDLLVYTKDEWDILTKSDSSFYKSIEKDGLQII